jgi:hypothetical protein
LVFRRNTLPDARGLAAGATGKPHVIKSRRKSGNLSANGVDLLTDNPDSEGSRNSKEFTPFVAR